MMDKSPKIGRGVEAFWTPLRLIRENPIPCLGLVGCDTAAVRVTCIVALAYAIGTIEDRADKGNLMYQSELISIHSKNSLALLLSFPARQVGPHAPRRRGRVCGGVVPAQQMSDFATDCRYRFKFQSNSFWDLIKPMSNFCFQFSTINKNNVRINNKGGLYSETCILTLPRP
jgi:hypothetical protein